MAAARNGLLALWLDGEALSPTLRFRMFTRDGAARTAAASLGESTGAPGDAAPSDAMPLDGDEDRFAAVLRTVHGPRVARITCGAVP